MSCSFNPTNSQMVRGSLLLMLPMVVKSMRPLGTISPARHLRNNVKSLLNWSKYASNTAWGLVLATQMLSLFNAVPALVTNSFGAYKINELIPKYILYHMALYDLYSNNLLNSSSFTIFLCLESILNLIPFMILVLRYFSYLFYNLYSRFVILPPNNITLTHIRSWITKKTLLTLTRLL